MKTGFEIIIRSMTGALEEVLKQKNKWNVLSIRDPFDGRVPIDSFLDLCCDVLALRFDDVDDSMDNEHGYKFPQFEDVEQGLDWAQGKDKILVHCRAGISRSSAMAYLIACKRVGAEKAISVLDSRLHWPNQRIVRLGAAILKDKEIQKHFLVWRECHKGVFAS